MQKENLFTAYWYNSRFRSKTHIFKKGSLTLCGLLRFNNQWTARFVNLNNVECAKCKKIYKELQNSKLKGKTK
jgi:hypothetical protein